MSIEEKDTGETQAPILIDLGKHKSKRVKALRKGHSGGLLDEVQACVAELQSSGSIDASAQPVIIVVSEKKKRRFWS